MLCRASRSEKCWKTCHIVTFNHETSTSINKGEANTVVESWYGVGYIFLVWNHLHLFRGRLYWWGAHVLNRYFVSFHWFHCTSPTLSCSIFVYSVSMQADLFSFLSVPHVRQKFRSDSRIWYIANAHTNTELQWQPGDCGKRIFEIRCFILRCLHVDPSLLLWVFCDSSLWYVHERLCIRLQSSVSGCTKGIEIQLHMRTLWYCCFWYARVHVHVNVCTRTFFHRKCRACPCWIVFTGEHLSEVHTWIAFTKWHIQLNQVTLVILRWRLTRLHNWEWSESSSPSVSSSCCALFAPWNS